MSLNLIFYFTCVYNSVFLCKFVKVRILKHKDMIVDNLKNASLYYNVAKGFEKAFNFLNTLDLETCEEGTFEVDGEKVKAIITSDKLKNKDAAVLETHQKHIDIQIPLSQNETYGWKSANTLDKTTDNYDAAKDLELYPDVTPTTYVTLLPGEFVIFLPEDVHAPLIGNGDIKKIIFKILVDK